jgi:FkbM family methyltransferase
MSRVLGLIRRLATLPGIRRLTQVDALMRISFSLRSSLVRTPGRFVRNELSPGSGVTATYLLKGSDVRVTIRHKTNDILVLDEVFSQREYRLPEKVVARLDRMRPLKVADIGANIGLFGAWLLARFPDAEILALEPDPSNADVHRRTIEANGAAAWRLVEGAATTKDGTIRFSVGEFARSHVADSQEPGIEVQALDIFPLVEDVGLLKIDIEGAEWPILQDPRFAQLDPEVVVLEYHPEGSPSSEPAQAAEALLVEAGFDIVAHHPKDSRTGVFWAVSDSA